MIEISMTWYIGGIPSLTGISLNWESKLNLELQVLDYDLKGWNFCWFADPPRFGFQVFFSFGIFLGVQKFYT